jgi:excisionase family DNA binding protein
VSNLLSTSQVAAELSRHRSTIYRLLRIGKLRGTLTGKGWRIVSPQYEISLMMNVLKADIDRKVKDWAREHGNLARGADSV